MFKYAHGVSSIYVDSPIYSSSLKPIDIDNGEYECLEHEYLGRPTGTRILVRENRVNGIVFHYITTKNDYGYTRQVVIYREEEPDPYPAHINHHRMDDVEMS